MATEVKLLYPEEAAALLAVNTASLIKSAKRGLIPFVLTPSGRYRYPEVELRRVLKLPHDLTFEEVKLSPRETASRFGVDVKTLSRWAVEGMIPCFKTPGGTRRYRESDVLALLANSRP